MNIKLKTKSLLTTGITMALAPLIFSSIAYSDTINLRFSAAMPGTSPLAKCGLQKFLGNIEKNSNGEIKVERHFAGSPLANPKNMYENVKTGVTQISHGPIAFCPGCFPLGELTSLPLISNDQMALALASTSLAKKYLLPEMEGVYLLATPNAGVSTVMMGNTPVNTLGDLKGKVIATTSKASVATMKALGANPRALGIHDIYESMKTGLVQGVTVPPSAYLAFKWQPVVKNLYNLRTTSTAQYTFINKDFYNGLSAKHKKVIDDLVGGINGGDKLTKLLTGCFVSIGKKAFIVMKKSKTTMVQPTTSDIAKAKKLVSPVIQAEINRLTARGLPAQAFFNDYLKAVKHFEQQQK